MRRPLPVLLAVLFVGCGPFVSGTWSDDPKNWQRAFRESAPADGIKIVHSWYTRTPHFTAEYAWFFELEVDDKTRISSTNSPGFNLLPYSAAEVARLPVFSPRPAWFKAEPPEAFELYWSKANPPWLIFQEKNGKRAFWSSSQM